jgi:uncharacterized protein (DUF433 family)
MARAILLAPPVTMATLFRMSMKSSCWGLSVSGLAHGRSTTQVTHGKMDAISTSGCYHQKMLDWSLCPVVERDAERVSGAWVFHGTRVPVAALFENLEEDASVHQFVDWFPGVTLAQAKAVLEYAARSTLEPA